jgi:hypothetical protein
MGTGTLVRSTSASKSEETDDDWWSKDYGGELTKKFCQ